MPYSERSIYVTLPESVDEIARVYFPGQRFDAAVDLEKAFKDGAIKAALQMSKREIDAWEWTQGHQSVYSSNLVVRRADLLRMYPDLWKADAGATERGARGGYSAAKLEDWYIKRVASLVARSEKSSRDEDWAAAKEEVGPSVTRDAIRELRKRRAPDAWSIGGAPTKSTKPDDNPSQ